jgi:hypothetical protein
MPSFLLAMALLAAQSDPKRQYLNLAEATLRNPITSDELRESILSPEGVAVIRALFERSVEESLVVAGRLVTPELGGEAVLDDRKIALHVYPDPIHPLVREMIRLRAEPERLLSFLESSPDGREVLSETGGLHALLWAMSANPPTVEQRELLVKVIVSAVDVYFKTWSVDPESQARALESVDWRGRYVGFWHIHPPRMQGEGNLSVGIEPSVEDMTNAVELGQFLTIVFQPDGFDAYDLSPLARARTPDLSRVLRIPHRSPGWKAHFQELVRARRERVSH